MCTSEVYFDEAQFPWRAKGDQRIGTVLPHRSQHEGDNEIGGKHAQEADASHTSKSQYLPEEFDRATRGDDASARRSRKVLVLFSGAYRRPDGLAAFLTSSPSWASSPSYSTTTPRAVEGPTETFSKTT